MGEEEEEKNHENGHAIKAETNDKDLAGNVRQFKVFKQNGGFRLTTEAYQILMCPKVYFLHLNEYLLSLCLD